MLPMGVKFQSILPAISEGQVITVKELETIYINVLFFSSEVICDSFLSMWREWKAMLLSVSLGLVGKEAILSRII